MTALRQRMLEDMQLRRLSPHTVEAYLRAVTKLAEFYKRSPDRISPEEVRTFLVDLVRRKKAAPSTYNQVRCALVFFYRVTLGREFALSRIVCQRNGKNHATPVGSGTVARTKRIPIQQRAEAAVIAWMRHQTTGYDGMVIPRVKGKRREVRRMLARRSHDLLERYRRGEQVGEDCPLKNALAVISGDVTNEPANPGDH